MIPTLGIMIGAYIFTRMADLLSREQTGIVLTIFAVLTILIDLIGMFLLLTTGLLSGTPVGRLPGAF